MESRLVLLMFVLHVAAAQYEQNNRFVINQDGSSASPTPRQALRPRFSSLSPVQLLQRANAARETQPETQNTPINTEKASKLFEKLLQSTPTVALPMDYNSEQPYDINKSTDQDEISSQVVFKESEVEDTLETSSPIPDRSYRKQYSTGRNKDRRQPNNDSTNLKELLKQSGTLSLSEILQQKNLSLTDLLQGKKSALSILREKQSNENKPRIITEIFPTESIPDPPQQNQHTHNEVTERIYTSTTTKRTPIIFKTNQRSPYLSNKRTSPAPTVFSTETRRWPSNAEPEYDNNKGDSREDILDLLQPGSPVSLAQLLSSRNMTLAELMEHRERGSRQQALVDLFSNLIQNTTQPSPVRTSVVVDYEPSSRKSSQQVISSAASPTRPRASRDPRLLDLIRRPVVTDVDHEEELEQTEISAQEPDHYEYTEDEEENETQTLPVGVQSAILASGGLLGLALVLFAAIFLCCRIHQRRRRGTRLPFLRNGKLSKSERNVVIKPAQNKQLSHIGRMDDF